LVDTQLDIAGIEAALNREGPAPVDDLNWLTESCRHPEAFWNQLVVAQQSLLPWPGKSVPLEKYDFFHDIVVRNRRNPYPALRWYDPLKHWMAVSYGQLGDLAAARAEAWQAAGVLPGHKVCIVAPMGIFVTVSLLAALRIGAEATLLPPQGEDFVQRRLTNLAPDWIAVEALNQAMVNAWKDVFLPDGGSGEAMPDDSNRSWSYPSGATVLHCFDPSSETPDLPCALGTDAAYLCPLRDGFIALALRPGRSFAAPGTHMLSTQPAMLLACLLNGATCVHVPVEELEKNPRLLAEQPLWAVQVTVQTAEILRPASLHADHAWSLWFRNPAESRDLPYWMEWIEAMHLDKAGAGNLLWQAARGGSILFSARRTGTAHLNVLPSPGVPWQMAGMQDSATPSLWRHGLFSPASPGQDPDEFMPTEVVLAGNRNEWLFTGMLTAGRAGLFYPKAEVLDALASTPFAGRSSVVEIPSAGVETSPVFTLAVFSAGLPQWNIAEIMTFLRTTIARALGDEFLPDHITVFPLYPPKDESGSLDHKWCRDRFIRGALFRKASDPLYLNISRLRARLWQAHASTGHFETAGPDGGHPEGPFTGLRQNIL